jgi:AraC-like DNA-binding protein
MTIMMQTARLPQLTEKINSPLKIANLVSSMSDLGISADRCLLGTNLDSADISDSTTKTSILQYLQACTNAIALARNPELPFLCGSRTSLSSFGLLGFGILCAPNLGEAIADTLRYQQLSGLSMKYDWHLGENVAYWSAGSSTSIHFDHQLSRFLLEEHLTRMVANLAEAFGDDVRPLEIRLPYARPENGHLYRDYFHCDVSFNAPQAELHIDATLVSRPPKFANEQMWQAIRHACDRMVGGQLACGIAGKVKKVLSETPGCLPDMEEVASLLGMTDRTLRRRLKQEGTSWSEIADEIRKSAALDYLKSKNLAIEDIAEQVGFSELASFRRAFKKWTGQSPHAYRNSLMSLA